MAGILVIHCPKCKSEIKAPTELAGKKIRCKKCGTTFPVQVPAVVKPAGKATPAAPVAKTKTAPPNPKAKTAPQPERPPAPPPATTDDEDFGGAPNPYGVTTLDLTPRCPHCAHEMESAEAILCLNCGYNTLTREHTQIRKTIARTPGEKIKWIIPGILCVFAIFVLIGGDLLFWFGPEETWKNLDEYANRLSLGIRVWVVIISCFIMYLLGRFAIRRLILHPTPPEFEKK